MKNFSVVLMTATLLTHSLAHAETAAPTGNWRGSGGAAASMTSGNTRSDSVNLTAEAARETAGGKLSLQSQLLKSHSTTNDVKSTTANQWKLGTRYDYNLSERNFGFAGLDLSGDELKSLTMRSVVSAGLGHHMIKTPENQLDLFGGLSYRADRYSDPGVMIDNQLETKFSTSELLIGEESTHILTANTTFKQRLAFNRNLGSSAGYRATFDTSLLVSLNKTMSLNVSLQDRYDSTAQTPVQKNDLMIFTGLNVKFGS